MDKSESQASVSNLGGISEGLLHRALETISDKTNFFRVTRQEVNSYGDFVLMCLPNNLWLSVSPTLQRKIACLWI